MVSCQSFHSFFPSRRRHCIGFKMGVIKTFVNCSFPFGSGMDTHFYGLKYDILPLFPLAPEPKVAELMTASLTGLM